MCIKEYAIKEFNEIACLYGTDKDEGVIEALMDRLSTLVEYLCLCKENHVFTEADKKLVKDFMVTGYDLKNGSVEDMIEPFPDYLVVVPILVLVLRWHKMPLGMASRAFKDVFHPVYGVLILDD